MAVWGKYSVTSVILKMVIKGVAPNPGMLHNIVYRNFFQRGGNHQFRQALRDAGIDEIIAVKQAQLDEYLGK